MILLIDNYDSFSYNLYQMIGKINADIKVIRNDELSVDEIAALRPSHIILSPGPGRPEDAGVTVEVAKTVSQKIPTLGVCLGHQAIALAYGGKVVHAKELMHGKQSEIVVIKDSPIFKSVGKTLTVARYHSLAAEIDGGELEVTAKSIDGEVMAIQHKKYPIYGVQFHPESILTPEGEEILKAFISLK